MMQIDMEYEKEDREEILDFPYEETARQVAAEVLRSEACPWEADVNLLITGVEEIRELNRTQRGIDSVTDVLSFPVCEFSAPSRFEEAEEDPFGCFDPESGHLLLGDIVICAERVRSQAEEYGHSRRREFAFLTAHSMLHLCGYDHMEPEEEAEMLAKQNEILNALGITREDG